MTKTVLVSVLLLFVLLLPASAQQSSSPQAKPGAKKFQEYDSKYKKRGDVHGLVFSLPHKMIVEAVLKTYADVGLTVSVQEPALGFIRGGKDRGVSSEYVLVWVDPEGDQDCRVEVRNIRLSRMGLIGLATSKDWSADVLASLELVLNAAPTLDQLRAAVAAEDSVDTRRRLIKAYLAYGKTEDALKAYGSLTQQYPASLLDRMEYADLLLAVGQEQQAVALLLPLKDKDPGALYTLARLYIETSRAKDALDLLSPVSERNPGDLRAKYQMARAAFLAGEMERAKAGFADVMRQAPDHPFAAQSKTWLALASSGSLGSAADRLAVVRLLAKEELGLLAGTQAQELAKTLPDGPDKYAAYGLVADSFLKRGKYDDVIGLLNPLAAQLTKAKTGELLYQLSVAYCAKRDFANAYPMAQSAAKAKYKPAEALKDALNWYR